MLDHTPVNQLEHIMSTYDSGIIGTARFRLRYSTRPVITRTVVARIPLPSGGCLRCVRSET